MLPPMPYATLMLIPYQTHPVTCRHDENAPATGVHNPPEMRSHPVHQMYGRLSINAARKSRQLDVDSVIFFLLFIGHRHPSGRSCTGASTIILFARPTACNTSRCHLADYALQCPPAVSCPGDLFAARVGPTQGRNARRKLHVTNFDRQFPG